MLLNKFMCGVLIITDAQLFSIKNNHQFLAKGYSSVPIFSDKSFLHKNRNGIDGEVLWGGLGEIAEKLGFDPSGGLESQ